ncbi:MAG: M2 family metallopeptidase, partial [Kofleriaceae bacterium]
MRKIIPLLLLAAACGPKKPDALPAPTPEPGGGSDVAAPMPPAQSVEAVVKEANAYIAEVDKELKRLSIASSLADWANQTDITDAHEAASAKAGGDLAVYITKAIKGSKKFEPVMAKLEPDVRRQFLLLKYIGQPAPDDPKQADELAKLGAEMQSLYGKGKVCVPQKQKDGKLKDTCLDIDHASAVLQKSRDPKEMLAVWQGWHENVGRVEKAPFAKFVGLANAGARGVGFKDVASMWKSGYDM